MATVSVIVPVYRCERYLRECVDSILAQTCRDLDVVLVDDGSPDSSGSICDEYARTDSRVRVVHKANGGLSSARNAGLDVARGDYVTFVDADDAIRADAVERMLAVIGDRDIAICGMTRGAQCRWPSGGKARPRLYTAAEAIRDTLYQYRIDNSAWGKLYRMGLFDGLRFTEGILYEDIDMFYRVYERAAAGIVAIDTPLYFYRITPGSILDNFNPRRLDVLDVTARIAGHYCGDSDLSAAAAARRYSANYNMLALASKAGMADAADRCWQYVKANRGAVLRDRRVRLKNKLGALLTYLGRGVVTAVTKRVY